VNSGTQPIERRGFLRLGLTAAGAIGTGIRHGEARAPNDFELEEWTSAQFQEAMKSGRFTSEALVTMYLSRIEQVDRRGPAVRSVIEINPDALSIARSLDEERKAKGPRGPLHGIPVLIKDNIDTSDKMKTTAGSLALLEARPRQDAFVVRRLREAGCVILGKTNLSEWANFRSTHGTSGWSGRGGQTRNPYALDRNPSGSSSGSGVAVAANLCAVAVGTETDGSVVSPSSLNCIVGIKPTLGLVSRSGIIPVAHSQDTAGPMARTVADAAMLLAAMAGVDSADPASKPSAGKAPTDYLKVLDPNGLKGARIGVARVFFGFNDHVDRLVNEAVATIKKLGAEVIDPVPLQMKTSGGEVLPFELKADLNSYLAGLGPAAPVRSLKEIIEFNERHRDREMPYFGQELFLMAEAKGPLTSPQYRKALAVNQRLARKEGIDAVVRKYRLDALVAPTEGLPWLTDLANGDYYSGGCYTLPAIAGYPHITVPAGFAFGLPVGVSFFGGAWSEPTLIRLAFAFEQATHHRKVPRFLATADFRLV
jgi:amidase